VSTILDAIETDVEEAVTWLESAATAIAKAITGPVLADLEALLEQELGILVTAGLDVATGIPVGTLMTNVLDAAGAAGKQAVIQIAPVALNAAVSTFAATKSL